MIVLVFSCIPQKGTSQSGDKPNILFVITDQWRRQAQGFLNADPVITPALDAFAKDAVFFKNAVVNRPICSPSRATMLSGQYPLTHGVIGNNIRLSTRTNTLGDITKSQGYHTAFIGKLHLDGYKEGFVPEERRHGFDYWILSKSHVPFRQKYYIQDSKQAFLPEEDGWEPDWMTDQALNYMDSIQGNPFCMIISYGPPHTGGGKGFEDRYQPGKRDADGNIKYGYGYGAPAEWEALYPDPKELPRRQNVKPVGKYEDESWPTLPGYYGALSSVDFNFGRIIKWLKDNNQFDNTIIVFTSDHGEMLGSHGRMTKGVWHDESIGIPCLISYPDKVQPSVISNPFSTVDMLPTILGLANIEIPNAVEGVDFSPTLIGEDQALPNKVFCSFDQGQPTENDRSWRSVYTEEYSYVLAKEQSYKRNGIKSGMILYDRKRDLFQMSPIYQGMGYDQVIRELDDALIEHLKQKNDPFIKKQWKTGIEPIYTHKYADDFLNFIEIQSTARVGGKKGSAVIEITAKCNQAVFRDEIVNLELSESDEMELVHSLSSVQMSIPKGQKTGSVSFTIPFEKMTGEKRLLIKLSNPSAGVVLGGRVGLSVEIQGNQVASISDLIEDF